jgi:hypothetical protein
LISIIICSRSAGDLLRVSNNIEDTVEVLYEIVSVDNSSNAYSIFSAYNEGARRAKYDLLCFCHEDIAFHTQGWGKIVGDIFANNSSIGLVGVAGSNYRTLVPSSWGSHSDSNYMNIIQGKQDKDANGDHWMNNPSNETLPNVVCVDGVWFCTRRDIALSLKFDEQYFKGFHCYDIDYSLSVLKKYKVVVTFDVLIEHFSHGSYSRAWVEESLKLHKKWKDKLPAYASRSAEKHLDYELEAALRFGRQMIALGYSPVEIFKALSFVNKQLQVGKVHVAAYCLRIVKMYLRQLMPGSK